MNGARERIADVADNSKIKMYEQCKNCVYRNKDTKDGYRKGICDKYDFFKPVDVLDGSEKCDKFEEDD